MKEKPSKKEENLATEARKKLSQGETLERKNSFKEKPLREKILSRRNPRGNDGFSFEIQ